MSKQKILITGAEGLIGKIIIPALKKEGHSLILLDKKAKNPFDLLKDNIDSYFKGGDTVIHLAIEGGLWDNKEKTLKNVEMLWNVLEACNKANVKRIVNASSINVYNYSGLYLKKKKINSFTPLCPHAKENWKERNQTSFYYSTSKILGENLVKFYHKTFGISALNLRFGAVHPDNYPYPNEPDDNAIWLSHEDLIGIIKKAVEFNGYAELVCVSNNSEKFVDLTSIKEVLNYAPKSDSAKFKT